MRLAIVGSRRFTSPDAEQRARRLIAATIAKHRPAVVISGGADGVDTWAEQEAERLGYSPAAGTLIVHVPNNRRWAPDGYEDRNLRIVNDCTHLLAIRCSQATTYGSGWTADRAEQDGRTVHRRTL